MSWQHWRHVGASAALDFWHCYGGRRVAKAEVIKTFLRDRPVVYFLADRLAERENLRALTRLSTEASSSRRTSRALLRDSTRPFRITWPLPMKMSDARSCVDIKPILSVLAAREMVGPKQ